MATVEKEVTVKDRFPLVDTEIEAPCVTYEHEFTFQRPMELGQNTVRYGSYYLVDVVGRTKLERDELTSLTFNSLEESLSVISGMGLIEIDSMDLVGSWKINRAPRDYEVNTLRVRLVYDDFNLKGIDYDYDSLFCTAC